MGLFYYPTSIIYNANLEVLLKKVNVFIIKLKINKN